jgi:hypothetical protein
VHGHCSCALQGGARTGGAHTPAEGVGVGAQGERTTPNTHVVMYTKVSGACEKSSGRLTVACLMSIHRAVPPLFSTMVLVTVTLPMATSMPTFALRRSFSFRDGISTGVRRAGRQTRRTMVGGRVSVCVGRGDGGKGEGICGLPTTSTTACCGRHVRHSRITHSITRTQVAQCCYTDGRPAQCGTHPQ